MIITDEHAGDTPQFSELIFHTSKYFDIHEVSADKAYSSHDNLDLVGKLGGKAYITFKEGSTGKSKGSRLWNKSFH